MEKFVYYIIYGLAYVLSLLSFRVLYFLSDGLYIVVYHLVGYRRKIVRKNLSSSFPEKSETELRTIERAFYHWFCDYIFETIKLLSISNEKLLEHIEFRGVEQMEEAFDRGQNCAAILGHYCNWEWLSATGLAFHRFPQAVMGLIYHP
ncbi:MAG: acetyltransferase, partial [Prevotella sp.]|nr:acetyltransferase [Prevotella sp.]